MVEKEERAESAERERVSWEVRVLGSGGFMGEGEARQPAGQTTPFSATN